MINKLTIQVLCDNTASADYIGEHGLSFFVKSDNINILFDTGRGYAFEHNAKVSKLNLQETDYLIFSHGHYDHTGGISDFFKIQETEKKRKRE
jgi:7,8-dihydropterin-6-yl-methyl-4-(beta-D-ribofuranosyl)aminobenzene 5'-phosphate synthase